MKKIFDVAVIGGGAAGLMAARSAALSGKKRGKRLSVILLEGNPKFGKKLLATGNGRCNLSNLDLSLSHYHGDCREAAEVLSAYPAARVLKEFEKMGLLSQADGEGRVYPCNLQASAVLQTLRFSCEEAGVQCVCGFFVQSIIREKQGYLPQAENGENLAAKSCILASGGAASPKHSCGTNGYELARRMGHSVTECLPALVPLKTDSKLLRPLKGMRSKVRAALYGDGREFYGESGEVIFGDGTLSGICIFNLSSLVCEHRRTGKLMGKQVKKLEVSLDLAQNLSHGELAGYLQTLRNAHPGLPAGEMLSGLLNLKVGQELVKYLGVDRLCPISELDGKILKRVVYTVKDLRFSVMGLGPMDAAQVTSGGVPLNEVNLRTMESKIQPGLYLTGELLNVNGDCGGYNLHWAWATGLSAGKSAAVL